MEKESPIKALAKVLTEKPLLRCLIYAAALLPLLLFREATPTNELKYLTIADEALRDGHFWCFFLDGAPYADKPPLYFWIIMAMRSLLGVHCIPILELFSLIPALGTILVMERWCRDRLRPEYSVAAELALLTSAWFLGSAVVLRMDMLMTLFITLAMRESWRILEEGPSGKRQWLFGLYVFLAIFSKGPVGFLLPFVCTAVYLLFAGKRGDFWKIWGWRAWCAVALPCLLWWGMVYAEGGSGYINDLLVHQTVGRAVDAFHHKRPFYFYLYSIWYAMGPWAFVSLTVAVSGAVRGRKIPPMARYFLIVATSFLIMMSCISGKLEIYLLPVFGYFHYGAMFLLQQMEVEEGKAPLANGLRRVLTIGGLVMLAAVLLCSIFFMDKVNALLA